MKNDISILLYHSKQVAYNIYYIYQCNNKKKKLRRKFATELSVVKRQVPAADARIEFKCLKLNYSKIVPLNAPLKLTDLGPYLRVQLVHRWVLHR